MKSILLVSCVWPFLLGCSHNSALENPARSHSAEKIIDFYSTKEAYGEFSNFALFPVRIEGKWWPTSEHYYQAQKYDSPSLQEWVRQAPTPMEAALRGRDKTVPKRADWEQAKDRAMEIAVRDKFTRYPELKKQLLATGNARIYEHTEKDCYWGDCGDRSGQNKLGLLLEKIRAELRADHLSVSK